MTFAALISPYQAQREFGLGHDVDGQHPCERPALPASKS